MVVAITLFTLQPGRKPEQYRWLSREFIGPAMLELPSVRGFTDGTAIAVWAARPPPGTDSR